MKRAATQRLADPHKAFVDLIRENAHRHRVHEVFRDFCELIALTISNSVDRAQYAQREARYLEVVARYEPAEVERFPQMLGCVVDALEAGFHDCLGKLFMSLELGDTGMGQFFTPYEISLLMAKVNATDLCALLETQRFVTLLEPAVGAGGMVIAMAQALHEAGYNFQQRMHVSAIDIDQTAVHMTYIQCSLLHIPAVIVHGNSIAMQEWGRWYTPAHVLGGWSARLRAREASDTVADALPAEPTSEVEPPLAFDMPPPSPQRAEENQTRAGESYQLDLFA